MTKIDKLLMDIHIEAKEEEYYSTNEEELGEVQERLATMLLKLVELGAGRGENNEGKSYGSSKVRLPKLQLPVLCGNLKEWITFKELFEAVVHNNKTLSGTQKLQYLKGITSKLLDNVVTCTRLLKILGQSVEHWNSLLVFLVTDKRDNDSKRQWQLSLTTDDLVAYAEYTQFLE
ncbi:hypothetical protein PR048_025535 [Dryococelus australis]|uniref:Uncharacterized protein n=1 Tax=Dryococelus australis TaxID=614101 RepID=A0ABQ9GRK8_9NEOP|nr:hypothetical protein PR048_025535 [Dryococelus australis]